MKREMVKIAKVEMVMGRPAQSGSALHLWAGWFVTLENGVSGPWPFTVTPDVGMWVDYSPGPDDLQTGAAVDVADKVF